MIFNLWTFLSILMPCACAFLIVVVRTEQRKKMKMLELEELKAKKLNIHDEIDEALERNLKPLIKRIEVLEAIVTDKDYRLSKELEDL